LPRIRISGGINFSAVLGRGPDAHRVNPAHRPGRLNLAAP